MHRRSPAPALAGSVRRPHSTARRTWAGALSAVLAASALTLTGLATDAAAADINNAKNPGFESGLANWTCSSGTGSSVATPARSGAAALKATPAGHDNARCSQTVAVKPNSRYTLSAWVQGGLAYLGATGTGTTDVSTWTPDSSGWKQLTTSFTTGANTTSVNVYTHGWYGAAAYFVDDVSVFGPDGGGGGEETVIPVPPTDVAVGGATKSSLDVSWKPVANATGYNVYRDGLKVQSVSGASAVVTGLAADTEYTFQVTATNAAGESGKSTPPVKGRTAKDGPVTGLPKHFVTGYWQNFNNQATVQTLAQVSDNYDIIAVAFADATSTPGAVTFNLNSAQLGGYTDAQFRADIRAKQAAGKKVIISVGGELGTVRVNDAASATAFANSVHALMQSYGFDGVDIDLENGLNATYMTQALRSLSAKVGSSLIIAMAPQTIDMQSTSGEYFKTALNIKDILTVVNTQYYNSGAMLGCDGKVYSQGTVDFLTALTCIQVENGLDPSQVAIGLPSSTRAAGGGYVSPSVVNNALDCLTKLTNCGSFKPARAYPALRGAMTWSINWDATAGNAWSNTVGPHVRSLP
ncbi:glycosyl hydrolase family 18 protein [Streptomyces sp. NPDC005955]|uniref:chitinase n=1 Tax=Streptomyces sp. NPDC005955 TaxID=3364738 RepID=UPI0036788FA2